MDSAHSPWQKISVRENRKTVPKSLNSALPTLPAMLERWFLPGPMTLEFFLRYLNFPLVSRHIHGFCLVKEPRGPAFNEHL